MIEQVGQQLGNYRLKRLLGKGAFADVYLSEHQYLNTAVAVKVLHARLSTSALTDFLTEARHASQLMHPNIVRVFDFGLEGDVPFLVMDYAPHGNLRQKHPSGSVVPLPAVVSYIMALASALQYAHDQHLIHRDLKPENVLLGPNHEVLLSDFSLALLTSDREAAHVKECFGPLPYMAPELICGQPVPASDQYALAVMAYEWLCGHPPFQGLSAHLSHQHLYSAPPSLCDERPDLPRAVEQVLFKGLSKEPAQRYLDVQRFARALEEASQAVPSQHVFAALPATHYAAARSSLESQDMRFGNVPQPLTSLIGREQELEEVRELLLRPHVRLITLSGAGGIGKTRLALSLGNEMQKEFAAGVCFVSLASINDPELAMPAILQALGLREMSVGSPLHLLKTFLRDMNLLLVLDSFEQVLSAAPQLVDLLSACSGLKILVTSRALLRIGGEYAFTVSPLDVPDLQGVSECESLSRIASVALFVQRAQAVLLWFRLTDENAGDIAAICARLEGVPLAIELAAEQSNVLPPSALLARLEHPLKVLRGGRRDAPLRQQTLLKTLDWNDDFLSTDELALFRRLAVFPSGCTLQAAEAVSMALGGLTISALDGVRALVNKSLLQCFVNGGDEPRVSFMEMVRGYALERLAECGELEMAREAHAAYYLALAERAESVLDESGEAEWRGWLEGEVGNLRAALQWMLERRRGEEALRLAAALRQFWALTDYLDEGRSYLEQALAVSLECQAPVSRSVRAKSLYAAGWLAYRHDPAYALPLLEESLRLFRSLEDKRGEASVQSCLSAIRYNRCKPGMTTTSHKGSSRIDNETTEYSDCMEKEVRREEEEATPVRMRRQQPAVEASTVRSEESEATPLTFPKSQVVRPARFTEPLFPPAYEELTAREIEVLRKMAQGLSNKQIAESLVISPHTVNGHLHSIFGKLALNTRSAATRYALEHQLA